jgi:hypothetical protein
MRSTSRSLTRLLILATLASLAACDNGGGLAPDEPWASRIELSTSALEIRDGDRADLRATLFDASGRPIAAPTSRYGFIWTVADSSVARVEGTGPEVNVRSRGVGTTVVSVRAVELWTSSSDNAIGNGNGNGNGTGLGRSIQVKSKQQPSSMTIHAGDGQKAKVTAGLPDELQVRLVDKQGSPVAEYPVSFHVASDAGKLTSLTAHTNADGIAGTRWTFGTVAGEHDADVTADGLNPVRFTAQALPDAPSNVAIESGNNQASRPGTKLAAPLVVLVTDQYGNPAPGASVRWSVASGGGSVTGAGTTDASGQAAADWTLGSTTGAQTLTASAAGKTVQFAATATNVASVKISSSKTPFNSLGESHVFAAQARDGSGNLVSGVTFAWTTSNASVLTAAADGRMTAKSIGTVLVVAAAAGLADTMAVTVQQVPASVDLSSSSLALAVGSSAELGAVVRDARGNAIPNAPVSWASSAPSVASVSDGRVSAVNTGSAAIIASSSDVSAQAQVSVSGGTSSSQHSVDMQIVRWGGSGTVLVSNAIPLAPGMLMPGQTGNLRILVGSQEQQLYVEELGGRHRDGSLRSVLVQFEHNVGSTPIAATVEIGASRSTPNRSRSGSAISLTRPMPGAVILPTNPSYLISTRIVGPTVTVNEAYAYEPRYVQQFRDGTNGSNGGDSRFAVHLSDYTTASGDAIVWRNYYDRSLASFAHWVQSGDPEFFRWGVYYALAWRDRYFVTHGCSVNPHQLQIEGLGLLYTLLGDETSRDCVGTAARNMYVAWFPNLVSTDYHWAEGRPKARMMELFLTAWKIGESSRDWASILRQTLNNYLPQQSADGAWRYASSGDYSLNFMSGLLHDAMIRYYEDFEADPRIVGSVAKGADFLWTQWVASDGGFQYAEGNYQYPDGQWIHMKAAPDLNLLIVNSFGFAYQQTRQSRFRERGDVVFQEGVRRAWFGSGATSADKQYNQQFRSAFRYFEYRR